MRILHQIWCCVHKFGEYLFLLFCRVFNFSDGAEHRLCEGLWASNSKFICTEFGEIEGIYLFRGNIAGAASLESLIRLSFFDQPGQNLVITVATAAKAVARAPWRLRLVSPCCKASAPRQLTRSAAFPEPRAWWIVIFETDAHPGIGELVPIQC